MIQFYLLSVLLNILGGLALATDETRRRDALVSDARRLIRDPTLRLVLGILALVTGAFKLLSVIRGDIPVVGDFLPAIAGLAVGATLLLELAKSDELLKPELEEAKDPQAEPQPAGPPESVKSGRFDPLRLFAEKILLENKAAVGMAGIIAGLVHFLFPTMPIL
jgi:hypothetical protein